MPSLIRMANGVTIPFMGLGTGGKSTTEKETELSIRTALDLGYKHIDTAEVYGSEKIIGKVLAEYFAAGKLKRENIFITTKLPGHAHEPEKVEQMLREQLSNLRLDFVDLYLIHSPCSIRYRKMPDGNILTENTKVKIEDTWKAMETIYEKKLARTIGISNFSVDQIQRVYSTARIKPHNLQIEINLHWPQRELITLCQSLNISITAYAPLGCPSRRNEEGWREYGPLDEPILKKLSEKYKRTPAQILLRHLTQRNVVVVPKSVNPERIKENFESMNFFLTDSDIDTLNHIKPRGRLYLWKNRQNHPEYPFTEQFDD